MYRALQGRCGLYCGECEIYMAYSTNDRKSLRRIAGERSEILGRDLSAEQIKCLGCKSPVASCWGAGCKIRICAEGRGNEFCYQCSDFPCAVLESLFERKPQARENLRTISKIGPDAWLSVMMSKTQGAVDG